MSLTSGLLDLGRKGLEAATVVVCLSANKPGVCGTVRLHAVSTVALNSHPAKIKRECKSLRDGACLCRSILEARPRFASATGAVVPRFASATGAVVRHEHNSHIKERTPKQKD